MERGAPVDMSAPAWPILSRMTDFNRILSESAVTAVLCNSQRPWNGRNQTVDSCSRSTIVSLISPYQNLHLLWVYFFLKAAERITPTLFHPWVPSSIVCTRIIRRRRVPSVNLVRLNPLTLRLLLILPLLLLPRERWRKCSPQLRQMLRLPKSRPKQRKIRFCNRQDPPPVAMTPLTWKKIIRLLAAADRN